jgi:hypothetical protein
MVHIRKFQAWRLREQRSMKSISGILNASKRESALRRQAVIEGKSHSTKCLPPGVVSIGAEL